MLHTHKQLLLFIWLQRLFQVSQGKCTGQKPKMCRELHWWQACKGLYGECAELPDLHDLFNFHVLVGKVYAGSYYPYSS